MSSDIYKNDFYKKLGKKIFRLRKKSKISREKFSEITGINEYYIGEIERGEKHASIDVLFKISNEFNLKIHELINVEEETI